MAKWLKYKVRAICCSLKTFWMINPASEKWKPHTFYHQQLALPLSWNMQLPWSQTLHILLSSPSILGCATQILFHDVKMIISKIANAVFISQLILFNDSITINDLITINGSQMPPSNQEMQKIVGCYFSNSDYTHMVYIQRVRAKESKLYIAQELFVPL